MKQFVGLLKFEHKQYSLIYSIFCVLILIAVLALPHGIVYIDPAMKINESRFIITLITAIITFITAIGMLVTSLNHGKERKEIWLHSTASIYTLVGVKVIYSLIALIVMEACAFIGFFFIQPIMSGTIMEYVVLALYFAMLTVITYAMFFTIILVFFAFKLQLTRLTKKLNNVILFAAFILFFYLLGKLPDTSFLEYGTINLTGLNQYLPNVADSNFSITMLFSKIYIVEEIVSLLIFLAIYIGSCKWIERMLTR